MTQPGKTFPSEFIHPETGEVLCSQEEWRAALAEVESRLGPIYRLRDVLLTEHGIRFPAPELPPRTGRTETQERVARCPRCGMKLESEEPPE